MWRTLSGLLGGLHRCTRESAAWLIGHYKSLYTRRTRTAHLLYAQCTLPPAARALCPLLQGHLPPLQRRAMYTTRTRAVHLLYAQCTEDRECPLTGGPRTNQCPREEGFGQSQYTVRPVNVACVYASCTEVRTMAIEHPTRDTCTLRVHETSVLCTRRGLL
jgi:hypothetical protein